MRALAWVLLSCLGGCAAADPELSPEADYDDPADELGELVSAFPGRGPVLAPSEAPPSPPPAPGPAPPSASLKDPHPTEAEPLKKCAADTHQWWRKNKDRDITFIAFGDTQTSSFAEGCRTNAHFRKTQSALMRDAINSVGAHAWPKGAGFHDEGKSYSRVRGVLIAGDLTQSGSDPVPVGSLGHDCKEYSLYRDAFGRCGDEGGLRFPVYEGYGNHDFPWVAGGGDASYHPVVEYLDGVTAAHRPGDSSDLYDDPVAGTGHYAWRWDDVWFVNLDVKPGWLNEVIQKTHTRIVDPHDSLAFLKGFLQARADSSNRQIVIMTHYPLSSPRIAKKERVAFCKLIHQAQKGAGPFSGPKLARSFPVIHIHGHTHHEPQYKTWSCPEPYEDVEVPSFNVGTPLYPHANNGPGKLHFTVFRLGNRSVEAVGIGADKDDPNGKWSTVFEKRLKVLHEP